MVKSHNLWKCSYKRKQQQQVQGLTAQNDRIEKLIANISNNGNEEDYSNLKQIIKESIKIVITENKKLISVSFTAIIQTLKDDLQMVNLIYNVHTTNDSEQLKDNNNSITQYVESTKDSLLYLTEKNYENLIEALTNNVVNTAAASSSSNPTSSTSLGSYDQSDAYRIEEPEIYDNSKGDITDWLIVVEVCSAISLISSYVTSMWLTTLR